MKRIEAKVEAMKHVGDDQFGLRRGRGTRGAIGMMRVISERNIAGKMCRYILWTTKRHSTKCSGLNYSKD